MTYEQDHGAAVCKYAVKQDDGSYEDIEGAPTEKGYYRITVTAPSTDHYTASELTSYFRVIEMQDTTLSISAESKVYDGEPMPGLWFMLLITCSILLAVLVKLHKANIKDRKRS